MYKELPHKERSQNKKEATLLGQPLSQYKSEFHSHYFATKNYSFLVRCVIVPQAFVVYRLIQLCKHL